ncbi:DNA oxidative demethylase ALKBH2 isoform X2 [Dioscorea cayenensis subsp. rotundata]|uniref:DNA oxidative demethylase ALKBH2 isoform X2 n=1 Tax=Dioscorea cayennensis subsp. rotundata TaxID=55577 RepID=A0AB40BAJ3_DIOCR|nr:DNA oxidative demethylase ALKBH2 isoform X2 [Dioscorea cayenensis subsp. rotundata]
MSLLGFVRPSPNPSGGGGNRTIDLGNGSEVFYVPRFLSPDRSWEWFHYLDKEIPWTRPLIHVFGRSCVQPRDVCYVASKGLSDLQYSGYQPHAYSWDDYPVLKDILEAVHEALPGSKFNSLLLNRYKTGSDYVSWHSDDEKLYGPAPEIASVSFGCEREFLLKKKPTKKSAKMQDAAHSEPPPASKRHKSSHTEQHAFVLKHGSMLVMRGYTQRDWLHSVPKRSKANSVRINLTFRQVMV